MISSGPFTLAAGGETTIDFAYVFTRDTTGPNGLTTSVARNKTDLQRVQDWFDNNNFPSCLVLNPGVEEAPENDLQFILLPNPATDVVYIKTDKKFIHAHYIIYDISGRAILSGDLKKKTVSIENLESGMYLLMITDDGISSTKKFIKQ